jgi:molecular chaperone GrpE
MTSKEKAQEKTVKKEVNKKKETASVSESKDTSKSKSKKTSEKSGSSKKLKQLEAELQEQKNKYLRLSADFDNFRKRTMREKAELSKIAGESIFVSILPVLDDLDRAMKAIGEATDMDAVKEGMQLIYNKFSEYLKQQGVKEIEAMHQEFDTDVHEAVTQIPAEENKLKGKVVDVIEKGYFLDEKVIRYSKVVIGV